MNHYRRAHLLAGITVSVGFLAHAIASELPGSDVWTFVAFLLLLASRVALRGRMRLAVPRWIFNLLLLAATLNLLREGFVVLRQGQPEQAVSTLANYLLALQVIKLFESRTPRDLAQTIALNAMLILAAVLESVTFPLAITLAVYAPLLLVTVYAYHLYAGAFQALRVTLGREPTVEELGGKPVRGLAPQLGALAFLSLIGTGAVATVVFFIMPRGLGEDSFGRLPAPSAGATPDFKEEVQLGGTPIVSESRDIVLTMQRLVQDQPIQTAVTQYLRGVTLDEYDQDKNAWVRSKRLAREDERTIISRSRLGRVRRFDESERQAPGILQQRIVLRSRSTPTLFALNTPIDLIAEQSDRVHKVSQNPLDRTVRARTTKRRVRYDVLSDPDYAEGLEATVRWLGRDLDSPTNRSFALGPVANIAQQLLAESGLSRDRDEVISPLDPLILDRFQSYLRGDFTYTLENEAPEDPERDPIEWFLTERKSGHCEYFASAMVAMCRAVGIQARVVTGFATSEYDPASEHYVARRNHAHAWVEAPVLAHDPIDVYHRLMGSLSPVAPAAVFLADPDLPLDPRLRRQVRGAWQVIAADVGPTRVRWRTYDPTPPSDRQAFTAEPTGVIAWVTRMYERAEASWITGVMAFDARQQISLLDRGASRVGVERFVERLQGRPERAMARMLSAATIFVGTFAIVATSLFVARAVWRRLRHRVFGFGIGGAHAARAAPAMVFFTRAERALRKLGRPRPPHRPPLEHAMSLRDLDDELADAATAIARLHYEHRYRAEPLTDAQIGAGRDHLRTLLAAVGRLRRSRA